MIVFAPSKGQLVQYFLQIFYKLTSFGQVWDIKPSERLSVSGETVVNILLSTQENLPMTVRE